MDYALRAGGPEVASQLTNCLRLRELRKALEHHGVDPDALLERYEAIPTRHRNRRRALLLAVLSEDELRTVDAAMAHVTQDIAASISLKAAADGQVFVRFKVDSQHLEGSADEPSQPRRRRGRRKGISPLRRRQPQAVVETAS